MDELLEKCYMWLIHILVQNLGHDNEVAHEQQRHRQLLHGMHGPSNTHLN
jgi:tmRNA-binding protein